MGGGLLFALIWLVSEVDRIRYDAMEKETDQLLVGYTGSIRDAQCSSESDRKHIFTALGAQTSEVDKTIEVLISCGMSTRSLREAAELNINMVEATQFRVAPLALTLSFHCEFFSFLLVSC